MSSSDAESRLSDYKESLKSRAEKLVKKEFPQRIMALEELIGTPSFKLNPAIKVERPVNIPIPKMSSSSPRKNNGEGGGDDDKDAVGKKRKMHDGQAIDADEGDDFSLVSGSKVVLLPQGTSPCNAVVADMIAKIKPKIVELVEAANLLKMWVTFLIPRIEDGNNFGVSVQEDTLGEIRQVESDGCSYLDAISSYHLNRGKVITKIAKYPHVEDFRQTIIELDEKQALSIRLIAVELKNHYAVLHDIICKNWDKIKKPRNINHDTMYWSLWSKKKNLFFF